jgi:hypothetical protein
MRTTIRLDDDLLKEAKGVAVSTGKTLNQVIEDSLRESLLRRRASSTRKPFKLRTFKGNGIRPGIDIYNSAELLDIMDGLDAASRR